MNETKPRNELIEIFEQAIKKSEYLNADARAKADLQKREEYKQRLMRYAEKMARDRYGKSLEQLHTHELMPIIQELSTLLSQEKNTYGAEDLERASATAKTIVRLKSEQPKQQNDEKAQ